MQYKLTATAQNKFTPSALYNGPVNVSIAGTFTATVTLQRSFNGGTTWKDVSTWTAAAETSINHPQQLHYRLGVKTGEFTSGTIFLLLGCDA